MPATMVTGEVSPFRHGAAKRNRSPIERPIGVNVVQSNPPCEFVQPSSAACRVYAFGRSRAGPTSKTAPIRPDYRSRLTAGEACTLRPFATVLGTERSQTEPTEPIGVTTLGVGTESWFSFRVELPDIEWGQTLRLFVAEPAAAPFIQSLSAVDGDTLEALPKIAFTKTTQPLRTGEGGAEAWHVWEYRGYHHGTLENSVRVAGEGSTRGKRYYLRVVRLPSATMSFHQALVGYQTNLAWIYGPGLKGAPCILQCEEESEWGHDEIYLSLKGKNFRDDGDYVSVWPWMTNEVKEWPHILNFDGNQRKEWTEPFFAGLAKTRTHADGTSFAVLPALGFINDIAVQIGEDDTSGDDIEEATFRHEDFPLVNRFNLHGKKVTFENDWDFDGVYSVKACNASHDIPIAGCASDAECVLPYRCRYGLCE